MVSSFENDLDSENFLIYEKEGLKFFSVWDFDKRDHLGISPIQIKGSCPLGVPLQCILRFSKANNLVLDPFCGSGTTLIACTYLRRKGVAIEISPKIAEIAKRNLHYCRKNIDLIEWLSLQKIIIGDSIVWMNNHLKEKSFDLIFAHPPYWNLLKYSDFYSKVDGDLSSESSLSTFLSKIDLMFRGINRVLRPGKYACVLIGDVFLSEKKVIPLDFYFTQIALSKGFEFHSKVIKITRNATSRRDKLNELKARSIKSNFFICIHDYLLIFKKRK